ncbi:Monocarboxylate transporter 12, partial [Armadillidium vulgare]
NSPPEFIPPDGGYGWIVAFSACVVNFFIVGFIKGYGVLYLALMAKFPNASSYQASWLPVFLSTTGLLIGIGVGLTITPGVLITSLYFEKRQALASAICVSGNAIGGFVFPPLIQYLLNEYELDGTLLILAALQLNICAASMLYRPICLHAIIQQKEKQRQITLRNSGQINNNLQSPFAVKDKEPSFNRCEPFLRKLSNKAALTSLSFNEEDSELRHQVSFLRSSSLLNSIPDLTQYARSWSYDQNTVFKHQLSMKNSYKSSKNSVNTIVTNGSNTHLEKDICTKGKRDNSYTLIVSERKPGFKERHSSSFKEKNVRPLCRLGFNRNSSQPILARQYSKRTNNRMSSLLEMDCDSVSSLPKANISEVSESKNNSTVNVKQLLEENLITNNNNNNIKDIENYPDVDPKQVITIEPKVKKPRFLDFSLLKSYTFWLVSVTVSLMAVGAPHALFFLPAYAASTNIDKDTIIYLMSISSVVDLVGRLGIGFVSDLRIIRYSYLYASSSVLAGIALLLLPNVSSIAAVGVFLSMYGFGVGGWFVLIPPILAIHHGTKKIASSYGLVRMFHGVMNTISPQGILIDKSGGYEAVYYFMGASMALGGILMFFEPLLVEAERKRKEKLIYVTD